MPSPLLLIFDGFPVTTTPPLKLWSIGRMDPSRVIGCALIASLTVAMTGCGMMNGHSRNTIGMHHFKKGNYAEAARHFNMAAVDDPQNADYVQNLATAHWKQGNSEQAAQLYRQALNIDPMHQPTYHSYARLLSEQGRTPEAASMLAMWSETQPYIAQPQVELAWLNRETGNHAASEQNLRQALEIEPNNATALAHLGQVYQDQGRSGEAVAMYQRSLYQDYFQPQVKSRIASLTGSHNVRARPSVQAGAATVIASQPLGTPVAAEWPAFPVTTAYVTPTWQTTGQPQVATSDADPAHPGPQISSAGPVVDPH